MSFFGDRANLLGKHGTKDAGWNWHALKAGKDDVESADTIAPPKQPRPRSQLDVTRQLPSRSTVEVDLPRSITISGNQTSSSHKRHGSVLRDVITQADSKKRKVGIHAVPRPAARPTPLVRDAATARPEPEKPRRYLAVQALPNTPFIESDSDNSDDEKPSVPISAQPPLPKTQASMEDRDAALAQSARLRKEAERKKKARQTGTTARLNPALVATGGTLNASVRPRATPQPPQAQLSGYMLQKYQRNSIRPSPKPPVEVLSLDSDSDDGPTTAPPALPQVTAPLFNVRKPARDRSRLPAVSVEPQKPSAAFRERLAEVKKEQPVRPLKPTPLSVQPRLELPIESAKDRRDRLREEAEKSAELRLQQERTRAEGRAKAQEEQRRQEQEAQTARKRQEDEQLRTQLAQEAKAREAAIERLRRQDLLKQQQREKDAQQSDSIQEQVARMQEEKKQKKAIEDAEREKKKAEDAANREKERLHSIEQKRAERAKRAPVLDEQAQQQRDERIRLKKERAARNKQDDDDGELVLENAPDSAPQSMSARARQAQVVEEPFDLGNEDDDKPEAYTPTATLAPKPLSLNSTAGLRAVDAAGKQMRRVPGTGTAQRERHAHGRSLGEILPEDASILKWRDTGSSWEQVKEKFSRLTGKSRSPETLRLRYNQVSTALNEAHVEPCLRRRMLAGHEEARKDINIAVHGDWPISRGPTQTTVAEAANTDTTNQTIAQQVTTSGQQLNEIGMQDARLVLWKHRGKSWQEIIELYRKLTGDTRAEYTLKRRERMVSKAFGLAKISPELKQALADGDEDVKRQVNTIIHGRWPPPAGEESRVQATRPQPQGMIRPDSFRASTPIQRPASRLPEMARNDSLLGGPVLLASLSLAAPVRRTGAFQDTAPSASVPGRHWSESPDEEYSAQWPRPTTGGKTISWETTLKLLGDQAEAFVDREPEDYDSEMDEDDPETYYYHVYRVLRREYTLEDEEMDIDIEDIAWQECAEFEDRSGANMAARDETFTQRAGRPRFTEGDYHLTGSKDPGSELQSYTVVNNAVGQLDVRVEDITRTPEDDILPQSKRGTLCGLIYNVRQCVTRTAQLVDDVLHETTVQHSIKEDFVTGTMTSHLAQANERAIMHFVDVTRRRLRNLDRDAADRKERIEYVRGEFGEYDHERDDDGEVRFDRTFAWPEKGEQMRVWVQREVLTGPRNHFQLSS